MLKIVYFLITFIEIILTAFIVYNLIKAKDKVDCSVIAFDKKFEPALAAFRQFAKSVSIFAKFFALQRKYEWKIKTINKILKLLMNLIKAFSVLKFLKL